MVKSTISATAPLFREGPGDSREKPSENRLVESGWQKTEIEI
jgi:hypothetical protein